MALKLNKTALKQERDRLRMAERFLPSLDLKRQKLRTELKQTRAEERNLHEQIIELERASAGLFALMGSIRLELSGLVTVRDVRLGSRNVVGVNLPTFEEASFEVRPYSTLAKPLWVDRLVALLQDVTRFHLRLQVVGRQAERLDEAARKATQRYNLFDKVIIPTARRNIARIQVALGDADRAAVVRSKLAKSKHS